MTITMQTDHEGTYVFITADGEKIPRGFTPETDRYQVAKFLALLNEHEQEITEMTGEYRDKLEWNARNVGQGKYWPIFAQTHRLLDRLQKRAGIVDS